MPSNALVDWNMVRQGKLDEMEAAHQAIGGLGPGRRYATEQVNHAYAMLLSSQFQGYCRELHTEAVDFVVNQVSSAPARGMMRKALLEARKLDRGNPNPGNIGSDYGRFGLELWVELRILNKRNQARQDRLEELNRWRNAIAHQDFDPLALGSVTLRLAQVRRWRDACHQLAVQIDFLTRAHLESLFGTSPW